MPFPMAVSTAVWMAIATAVETAVKTAILTAVPMTRNKIVQEYSS